MSNTPPSWPNGAPPPANDPQRSPFQPLQPPPYGTYAQGYSGPARSSDASDAGQGATAAAGEFQQGPGAGSSAAPGPAYGAPAGPSYAGPTAYSGQPYGTYSGQRSDSSAYAGQPNAAYSGQPYNGSAAYAGQPNAAYLGQPYGDPTAAASYPAPPQGSAQAPLGPPPPPHVTIDAFAPRRDRRPLIIVGIAALLLVGAIITAIVLSTRPAAIPTSATASPHASATAARSPAPNGQAVAFESSYDHATGYWQITQQSWDSSGVLLNLSIRVDSGSLTPYFYVFNNDTNAQYRVDLSLAPTPRFPSGSLTSPQSYSGNVYIPMPHVDGTIIMMSGHQSDAISALAIKK